MATTPNPKRSAPRLPGGPVFVSALRAAAARPQAWLSTWALLLVLAIVAASPWLAFFDRALSGSYEPGSMMGSLTEAFRFDHRGLLGALERSSQQGGAALAFLAMLVGAFTAGGWLQIVLERTEGRTLRRFFLGGARYFWRFARVLVLTLLALSLGAFLFLGAPWEWFVEDLLLGAGDGLEDLASERTAFLVRATQHGFFALWFALVMVVGDYTRARLALFDGSSSIWSWLCSLFLLLRRPIQVLRPAAALFALELIVLWLAGDAAHSASGRIEAEPTWRTLVALFGLVQLAALWRLLLRGAQIVAAVEVLRTYADPPARPDPWSERVGGPGGPQYSVVGSGDPYRVSI